MKKTYTSLIYISLAILLLVFLFRLMMWPGLGIIADVMFWVHIGAYVLYSIQIKDKDSRIIYPLTFLVLLVVSLSLHIPALSSVITQFSFVLVAAYTAFHLLVKDYMGENDLKLLRIANYVALTIFVVAGLFKLFKFPGVSQLFIVSTSALVLLTILTGVTKGLKRKV